MIKLTDDDKEGLAEWIGDPHSFDVLEYKVVDGALEKTQSVLKDGLGLLKESLPEFFHELQEAVRVYTVKNISELTANLIEDMELHLSCDEPDISLELWIRHYDEGLYKCSFRDALVTAVEGATKEDALNGLRKMKEHIEQIERKLI